MKRSVFQSILAELNMGKRAELRVDAGDKEYIRTFLPKDRLILLGGGHVSQALCEMASMLDFEIIVVDDRPSFAHAERFPKADRIICGGFAETIACLSLRDTDYVCVVTRGHQWDRECIEAILSGEQMPYYVGLISSRRRAEGLKDLLSDEGFAVERIEQIHSPIGLSIGAVTLPEIAVSICAELVQCRRQKSYACAEGGLVQTNTDIEMLRYLAEGNEPTAILLAVFSDGSTPVKAGAMMAVNMLGKGYGTVGGGCGEAAAITRSRRIIGTGRSEMLDLDMSNEAAADSGMVCGGRMKIWIEDVTN